MEKLKDILHNELSALKKDIIHNIEQTDRRLAKRATQSFNIKVDDNTGSLEIEDRIFDTKQGKATNHELLQMIRDYIHAKNISIKNDEQLDRLARFIKWRIEHFGAKQYGGTDIYTPAIEAFEKRMEPLLTKLYTDKVEEMLV